MAEKGKSLPSASVLCRGSEAGDMEQPLQSASIEVGEAQELDTELAMVRPSNCGRVDGDWDSQFRGLDQQFDTGSRCHRYGTGHGTTAG